MGVEAMVDNLQTKVSAEYKKKEWSNFIVAGEVAAIFKSAGNFTYARIFGA